MFFEILDRALPVAHRAFFHVHRVIGGAERGVQAADLVESIRPVLELVDRLAVVFAGLLGISQRAVEVAADFQGGGENVDAVEVRTERLLGLFHRGVGGVQRLIEVSCGT